jgi:hypothetical protein
MLNNVRKVDRLFLSITSYLSSILAGGLILGNALRLKISIIMESSCHVITLISFYNLLTN